ncbi:MAG: GGDEF domain-containing protein [endosymbiont of Escarpia spicata]|uniref:diguanylate cyclase n=1 Tax=endosymbiont of Escarpia spicata TaxID=2200908 RepID=A0A370DSU2_9GAMM|nr:MAG: GGDEF domain-containing protein [endosymbiont of Escarpia spicata]
MHEVTGPNSSTPLKQLFIKEEQQSERYANNARILFTFLYFLAGFSIRNEIPDFSFIAIISASLVNLIYGVLLHFHLKRDRHIWWLKYLSVTIDILLLSIVLYAFGTYRTFKSEAFLLYYLWIGLATIRFSPRLTLLSGVLSISLYLLIVFLAISRGTIELGTISEDFTTPLVSDSNIALRVIFLAFFTALAVYISSIYRGIAARAIREELRKEENAQLTNALDRLRSTQKQLAAKNRELARLSEIDVLTQLYNRRKIDQVMQESLDGAQRNDSPLALILLDIDHFKSINDRYGHQMGDEVIQHLAEQLKDNVRGNDTIGRWGGEEFLIICPDLTADKAMKLSERLRAAIAMIKPSNGTQVTGSFGITFLQSDDTTATLLKRADDALYQSKNNGRNRVTML